jgi:hypothetical protein
MTREQLTEFFKAVFAKNSLAGKIIRAVKDR